MNDTGISPNDRAWYEAGSCDAKDRLKLEYENRLAVERKAKRCYAWATWTLLVICAILAARVWL